MKRMKCFAYLRVSDPSQVKRDGFARQLDAIKRYARSHRLEITTTFREEGVSGTLEQRPALAEMMVSLEKNHHGVKTIVIEKLDRLARDLMVQEAIIRDFQRNGFTVISTTEGKDLGADDPTRKLVRQMMGAIAEYEKTMLVQKLRAARQRVKARKGKCEGTKRYDESEKGRAIIARIRDLRTVPPHHIPPTFNSIAQLLNNEGTTTVEGSQWTLFRVQQVYERYVKPKHS